MSSETRVIVCLLTADQGAPHVQRLIGLFSDPLFKVTVVTVVPLAGIQNTSSMTAGQTINAQRILDALIKAREEGQDMYTIVIKDSSVSSSSSAHIASTVTTMLDLQVDWDVAYLTRWLDRCDLYKDSERVGDTSTVVTKTISPNGTQALLFSPLGRDRVLGLKKMRDGESFLPLDRSIDAALNDAMENGSMIAYATVPNLFEFDVLLASSVSDLAKMSDCRNPPTGTNKGALPFMWFILVVLGVILVIWASRQIGPDDTNVK